MLSPRIVSHPPFPFTCFFVSSLSNSLSACSNGAPRWDRQTSIQVTATNCSSHYEILVGTRRESTTSSRFVSHPSPTFHPRPRRHPLRTAAGFRPRPATLAITPHANSAANPRTTTEHLASLQDASKRPRRVSSQPPHRGRRSGHVTDHVHSWSPSHLRQLVPLPFVLGILDPLKLRSRVWQSVRQPRLASQRGDHGSPAAEGERNGRQS